jgi:SAM-dependent methyltransferase
MTSTTDIQVAAKPNTRRRKVTTVAESINPEVVEQKVGAAFGALGGVFVASMIYLGHQLGLYKAMAGQGPMTSASLANNTGMSERFLREWLMQQAASGVIESRGAGTFELAPEAALVFADENNPASQIAIFAHLPSVVGMLASAERGFRTGLGNTYDAHGENGARMMDAVFGAWNRTSLVSEALPRLAGVVERLERGGKVADVGCGGGAGPIAVAKAFPAADVHGYDNSKHALKVAAENKAAAGISNVTFHNPDEEPLPTTPTFDLVMTLDCLHDMARPDLYTAAIRKAIKPDGVWFIVDVDGAATAEENLKNPMAGFIYGGSTAICLQSSASTPDGLKLGAFGLPEPAMKKLVTDAGFSQFKRVEGLTHPFNAYYEVRP